MFFLRLLKSGAEIAKFKLGGGIDEEMVLAVGGLHQSSPMLTVLKIQGVPVTDEIILALAEVVSSSRLLKVLNLYLVFAKFGKQSDTRKLLEAIVSSDSIEHLELSPPSQEEAELVVY